MEGWQKLLGLFVAGGLGSSLRYGLSTGIQRWSGSEFPLGILLVNVLGCLAFGFAWSLLESRHESAQALRMIVLVGFLGGFTTFSTYVHDSANMLEHGAWLRFAAQFLGHHALGLGAMFTGLWLGRSL